MKALGHFALDEPHRISFNSSNSITTIQCLGIDHACLVSSTGFTLYCFSFKWFYVFVCLENTKYIYTGTHVPKDWRCYRLQTTGNVSEPTCVVRRNCWKCCATDIFTFLYWYIIGFIGGCCYEISIHSVRKSPQLHLKSQGVEVYTFPLCLISACCSQASSNYM